jgi:hypothetical protein
MATRGMLTPEGWSSRGGDSETHANATRLRGAARRWRAREVKGRGMGPWSDSSIRPGDERVARADGNANQR